MSMSRRTSVLLVLATTLAFLLAFPLRDAVWLYVVVPLAYIWWRLYGTFPQQVYWVALLVAFLYIVSRAFARIRFEREVTYQKRAQGKGAVESLAAMIDGSKRGGYFRWKVARTLGLVAAGILEMRGVKYGRVRTLEGRDWQPPEKVQQYLNVGLNDSFASFPVEARRTPFDVPLEDVVAYLEEQLENNRDRHK